MEYGEYVKLHPPCELSSIRQSLTTQQPTVNLLFISEAWII